uniref:Uncharacterized protein n=1 Tax=Lepeophtheirus salmonis TaxID=72036 RepID=A0A0K2UJJ0_LEPSM
MNNRTNSSRFVVRQSFLSNRVKIPTYKIRVRDIFRFTYEFLPSIRSSIHCGSERSLLPKGIYCFLNRIDGCVQNNSSVRLSVQYFG